MNPFETLPLIANTRHRHPGTQQIVKHFEYRHLPGNLAATSKSCHDLAQSMVLTIPDGPELTAGLRKLLEAKDCFVRASMDAEQGDPKDDVLPRRPIADSPQA